MVVMMRQLFLSLLVCCLWCSAEGYVGMNYGSNTASAMPSPAEAVVLLKNLGVKHARIFGSDAAQIAAFAGTGIELVISAQNSEVEGIAASEVAALAWVKKNVAGYWPGVNITGIAVGEEVLTAADGSNARTFVLPAMNNLFQALRNVSLEKQVAVSTPHSTGVLASSFPPSMAAFNQTLLVQELQPILGFLSTTRSYFMLNLEPLYLFQQAANAISIDYALFLPNPGVNDTLTNLHYSNLFDAVLDAVYAALRAANHTELPVVVLKTGWPSKGDNETGVNLQNAAMYVNNLAKHALSATTPARPDAQINAYIYELFNEDAQQGTASNRNWGLFYPNLTQVYPVDLTGTGFASDITANRTWCVAKSGVSDQALLPGLNWACGQGQANCSAIQPGAACFAPDTVFSHTSYAYNSYYQKLRNAPGTCDFKNTAQITTNDPSYPGCTYPSSVRPSALRSGSSQLSPSSLLILLLLLATTG